MLPKIFSDIGSAVAAAGNAVGNALGAAGSAVAAIPERLKGKPASDALPTVVVCGMTGSGKSAVISAAIAAVGNFPELRGISLTELEGCSINSVGEYRERVKAFFKRRRAVGAWYCVSAGSKRFLETDAENVHQLLGLCGSVSVVLTMIDTVSSEELGGLVDSVRSVFGEIGIFGFSSSPALEKTSAHAIKRLLENLNEAAANINEKRK